MEQTKVQYLSKYDLQKVETVDFTTIDFEEIDIDTDDMNIDSDEIQPKMTTRELQTGINDEISMQKSDTYNFNLGFGGSKPAETTQPTVEPSVERKKYIIWGVVGICLIILILILMRVMKKK